MPYDASIVNDPQFKSLSESKQAKILANLVPSDMRGTQTAESNRQISSSEQLVQDYPPYRTGWEAAKREVSDVPGGFGLLSAPGVGVGEESGTAVHNVLAGVPGLGGPSGFAPAAGATLANLAGQFATDALLPGIVSRGAKAIAAPVRTVARWLDPFNKEKAINQFAQKHLGLPENIGSRITQLGEEAPTTLPVFPESVPGPSTPLDVKATVELLKDKATGKFAADYLGMPSSKGERIVNMGKEAFNLYKVAEATGTKIALTEPRAIIEDTLSSLTRTGREKLADDLVSKLSIPPQAKQANYSEVFRWVQEFRSKADALLGADNAAAAQLRKSAEGLLSKLDDSSTVVREANARYRLDQAAKVTLEALSGSKPAIKLKNLMQSDPSLAKGLNLTKPADVEKFLKAAGDIGDTGSRVAFVEKQGKVALQTRLDQITASQATAMEKAKLVQVEQIKSKQVLTDVLGVLREVNPGLKLKTALETDPTFAKVLQLTTSEKATKFIQDVTRIGTMKDEYQKAKMLGIAAAGAFGIAAGGLFVRSYVWHLAGTVSK